MELIDQLNKNFHSNLYTASQIAKKLGITANMVERIANENDEAVLDVMGLKWDGDRIVEKYGLFDNM